MHIHKYVHTYTYTYQHQRRPIYRNQINDIHVNRPGRFSNSIISNGWFLESKWAIVRA